MLSIVIPIYNEEGNLPALHERIRAASAASVSWKDDYEVILVDDGSSDRSPGLMKEIARADPHFKVITLSRNFGHQAAISAGLKRARGSAVVIMDGDLQDPPEELDRFLEQWRAGYDVVYAVRRKRKEPLLKRALYAAFYRVLQLVSNIRIPLDSGDFCVMDRKVVDVLVTAFPENLRFVRGLRAYAGFRQIGVPYERASRFAGETKYTLGKLVKLALDGILGFSTLPLRLATYLGFLISAVSFLVSLLYLVAKVLGIRVFGHAPGEVTGFATLAIGMFFLAGIMLMVLGIMGEYIGRIYIEVKKRPSYIIDEPRAEPDDRP